MIARCTRCGRKLSDAKSVARGYGRACGQRIAAEAKVSAEKPEQVAKAVELLAVGAVVPLRPGRVWLVVGSKGETYRTAPAACTCLAGVRGRMCYHRVATAMLAA
jgi:hypothetical protein